MRNEQRIKIIKKRRRKRRRRSNRGGALGRGGARQPKNQQTPAAMSCRCSWRLEGDQGSPIADDRDLSPDPAKSPPGRVCTGFGGHRTAQALSLDSLLAPWSFILDPPRYPPLPPRFAQDASCMPHALSSLATGQRERGRHEVLPWDCHHPISPGPKSQVPKFECQCQAELIKNALRSSHHQPQKGSFQAQLKRERKGAEREGEGGGEAEEQSRK